MIMMGNKKQTINAILGPHPKDENSDEAPSALHACAQELIECVHSKDAEGVVSAFKAMFDEMSRQPEEVESD